MFTKARLALFVPWLAALFLVAPANIAHAQSSATIIDSVIFGDTTSEAAHGVKATLSSIATGGLNVPTRQLLPQNPPAYEGGSLAFTLKVDGAHQNYVTVKLWGSDKGEDSGRLILFSNGKQIGYRDQGDYDVLNQTDDTPLYPGRFVYETLPLPETLTRSQTQIELTIHSLGRMWPYGTTYDEYQKRLTTPTRGIYAAYTHADPLFTPPASEAQGSAPAPALRPSPGPDAIDAVRTRVNAFLVRYAAAPTTVKPKDIRSHHGPLLLLSQAYMTSWCSVYNSPAALTRIVAEGDAVAKQQAEDPDYVTSDWIGAGGLGEALMRVYPALDAAKRFDETIALPGGKKVTRRLAWADVLQTSVDYWRTHRRPYTNQSMIVDRNIYTANEGLRLLDATRALPVDRVTRFLYESTGIEPWLGSDQSHAKGADHGGGADLPAGTYSVAPFGKSYYLVTGQGLSKELGYVGGYGETILHFATDMVRLTGDANLRDQLVKLEDARAYFRYPLPDADGYKAMFLESIIDNRTAHFPSSVAYGASTGAAESEPLEVAAVTGDPEAIGIAQQGIDDNQYFPLLVSRLTNSDPLIVLGLLNAVNDYQTVDSLPRSTVRLPMTDGEPDFAWSDPENAVLAIKHGDQRLYFNFYYRSERGINGVVRIHDLTPQIERIVTAKSDYQFIASGQQYTRPNWIDGIRSKGLQPPGEQIDQAWAGEVMPIAARPADATLPKYGDWGPFVGKAAFYQLRYGDYLIGINTSGGKTYGIAAPADLKSATDLISGNTIQVEDGAFTVAPLSTVVLWLGK